MPQTDYQSLIDAPTWDFINRTNSFSPPEATTLTIAEQRQTYDRMCAAFHHPHPTGVATRDTFSAGVPVRIYEPVQPRGTLVYLHGGGFVVGGLHSHDDVCAEICDQTGLRVVSVDYRLAPEHVHPAAYEDALAAATEIAARFGPIILAGDSAGGDLAASVTHALRGSTTSVTAAILIYPGLGGDRNSRSMTVHANAPMLTRADILAYAEYRFGGPSPVGDSTAGVLQNTDFTGLPPTHIFSAECDPLADDGRVYAEKITRAGGQAICFEDKGLVHGWLRARHSVPRAKAAFARIIDSINALS